MTQKQYNEIQDMIYTEGSLLMKNVFNVLNTIGKYAKDYNDFISILNDFTIDLNSDKADKNTEEEK